MNLIFFGDAELFSQLEEDFSFAPKLMTKDEEECRDWLEANAADSKVYLFIDYDLGKKKVDKYLLNLRHEFPELVAILVYENLKIKELKKHQQSKYAADGYIKKPLNKKNVESVLEDFELGAFISSQNLLEEGVELPPIPELGTQESMDSQMSITPLNNDEQEYFEEHGGHEATYHQDDINQGIQAVFDGVMGTEGASVPVESALVLQEDYDDTIEEGDESVILDVEELEESGGFGELDLEEEEGEEIDLNTGLSFEFNENSTESVEEDDTDNMEVETESELSDDATQMIGLEQLAAMANENESDEKTPGNEGDSSGEENMDQDGDELFDDDLDLDLNLDEEAPALTDGEIDKTIVEKYDPVEDPSAMEMELDEDFDDISIEDASEMPDIEHQPAMEMVDEDDDELLSELAGEGEGGNEFTVTGGSQEHILPKEEDLEFPSISELDAAALEESKTGHSKSEFHVEDFDEDSVDATLSQIVQTDKVSTEALGSNEEDFDPLEASIGSESSASFNAEEDFDDDFELDEEDSQLIDISKMDLTDPGSIEEGEDEDDEISDPFDDSAVTVMEKTEPFSGGDESETTLQFDSSTEQTKEKIAVQEAEVGPVQDTREEETDGAIDQGQGLVFENVSMEKTAEKQMPSGGLMTEGERKLISGHHESELMRLQAMIRQLREEREELLENIQEQETSKKVLERENLGLRAEVDELKIELEIIRKRHRDEMEEVKYRSRISEEKKLLAQEKSKKLDRELNRLQQRIHIDLNKVRQREKELESKLELAKIDSDSQVKARDQKIIELKRKIDQLEFNMENVAMKEQQSRSEKSRIEERLNRIMKTLRGSIELLEDDIQFDMGEKSEE